MTTGTDGPSPHRTPRLIRVVLPIVSLVLIFASVILALRSLQLAPPLSPPHIATDTLDPAVARLIEDAHAQVRQSPRDGQAWGRLGMILHSHHLLDEAEACYPFAAQFDPDNPRWPFFLGQLWIVDREESALEQFTKAVRLSGDQPDYPKLKLVQLLAERGRFPEALQLLEPWLQSQPDHPAATLEFVRIKAFKEADRTGAEQWLSPCLTNPHTAKAAFTLLSVILRGLNQPERCLQAEQWARQLPHDLSWPDPYGDELLGFQTGRKAWIEQTQHLLQQNNLIKAERLVQRLLEFYPDSSEAWLFLGRIRLVQGNLAEAQRALERHLEIEADSVDGRLQWGLLQRKLNQPGLAADSFARAARLKPDSEIAHYHLGLAQRENREPEAAIQAFRRAMRCNPAFLEAYLALADTFRAEDRIEDALNTLQMALQLNPFDLRLQQALEAMQSPAPNSP